jgi:16S rRNA processing protein RimM
VIHFEPGSEVFLDGHAYVVRTIRRADKGHQVAFQALEDRAAAETVRGAQVTVAERRELDSGEYWPEDLIGLSVISDDGSEVGVVSEVLFGPAQDRLLIDTSHGRFEVPFVDALIPVVDLEHGYVQVGDLPGLLSDSTS